MKKKLDKFDKCRYRSSSPEEMGEFSCCSDNVELGYICFKRDIEGVTRLQCQDCNKFREKYKYAEKEK